MDQSPIQVTSENPLLGIPRVPLGNHTPYPNAQGFTTNMQLPQVRQSSNDNSPQVTTTFHAGIQLPQVRQIPNNDDSPRGCVSVPGVPWDRQIS